MKDKILVLCTLGAYVLSVVASATDLEGNPKASMGLIAVSGIATLFFLVLILVRLWKKRKDVAVLLVSSVALVTLFALLQAVVKPPYAASIIAFSNIAKVVSLLAFFWGMRRLWVASSQEELEEASLEDKPRGRDGFQSLAMLFYLVTGVVCFFWAMGVVFDKLGFIGGVFALFLAPVTLTCVPFYVGFATGDWTLLVVTYGGGIFATGIVALATVGE